MPYAFVATRLDPSGSTTTPPLHILTSLLSPPSPLAPDPSRLLSVLPSLSSQYKPCSLVTRTPAPVTSTSIAFPTNKPLKSSLKYSNTGSFGHGKETSAPTQPHVPRDTVPSSSRVRFKDTDDGLVSIRSFHATGRPSALLNPDSDTESDTDMDTGTDDVSSFSTLFQRLICAGATAVASPLAHLKVTQMPLIPSLYIPPNPNVYLESISPILLASARPPLLRGTVRVRNIAFEKRIAVRFTIDDWTTVSEVLARYTGPAIPGAHHHHGDGDDDKWDRFAFSISLGFYAPRRAGASSHLQHAFTLLLAVRFTAPGVGEWWDNNGGNNFRIVLAHASAGSKVPGVSDPIPTAEFPRRPQAVTRFANTQATTSMTCTRSLLRPYVTPAPTVVTN
jgi:hypothetical protein